MENNAFSQTFHLSTSAQPVSVELDPDDWILKTVEQKVESPTFNRGILVVNGVSWNTYGSTITSEYADSTLSGGLPFSFWDAFSPPSGGYIPSCPRRSATVTFRPTHWDGLDRHVGGNDFWVISRCGTTLQSSAT